MAVLAHVILVVPPRHPVLDPRGREVLEEILGVGMVAPEEQEIHPPITLKVLDVQQP